MSDNRCKIMRERAAELTTAARLCYEALVEMALNYGEPSKHAKLAEAFQQAHERVDHALAAFEQHVKNERIHTSSLDI